MRVPSEMNVQLRCSTTADLGGVIVELKVTTGFKNPYFICFPKTDSSGRARLSLDDFVGQFKDHWESGLMDYQGGPEDAASLVDVSLFDPTWSRDHRLEAMAWPLLKHERTKWSSRAQEYEYRVSCRNHLFRAGTVSVDLHATPSFEFMVATVGGAA